MKDITFRKVCQVAVPY